MKRLLVVAAVAAALALAVVPVQGRVGPEVAVIDSNAVAASVGLISRVPAESAGGFNWTLTAITLDKAVAKAAGGTAGSLAETFFQSSSAQYRNPSLIGAQYPPTATIPAEARGGTPEGSPGGVAATHAVATEQPTADAEAQGGRGGDGGPMTVQGGTSSSHGELGRDGTVLTKAVAVASGIAIGGGAVTIGSATTQAVTTVPPHGPPTTDLKVTLTGVLAGGVPAEVTDQGLRISDQVPVGPGQLAAFNAALAQLAARGITVTAAPAVREVGAGQARAEGGGAVVRYTVTDQIGGDEEVVLAQARSRSTLTLAEVAPELPLPAPDLPAVGADTPAPTTPPPPPPPPPASGPSTAGADSSAAPAGDALAPLPSACEPGPDGTTGSATAGAPTSAACGPASSGTGAGQAAAGPTTAAHPALNLVGRVDDRALRRLRTGYRVILLLAAAATALHFAAQRSRTS